MTQIGIRALELQIKEQRVAYWETYHELPGCREMADLFGGLSEDVRG